MGGSVAIIGVPECFGANRDECGLAPDLIKRAGLAKKLDRMGLKVSEKANITSGSVKAEKKEEIKNIGRILEVNRRLCRASLLSLRTGETPVVIGGDHSISIGSIAALSIQNNRKCGVIYFDAHGDFNTPATSPSGNFHGMSLAFTAGRFKIKGYQPISPEASDTLVNPKNISIIGARSLDIMERKALDSAGVSVFTMEDIDTYGIDYVTKKAVKVSTSGNTALHISLDMDVLDPAFAPAVSTPVVGGMTFRELKLSLKEIHDSGRIRSIDVAEINPKISAPRTTIDSAIESILTSFGKDSSFSLL